jgi:hypothetical protein
MLKVIFVLRGSNRRKEVLRNAYLHEHYLGDEIKKAEMVGEWSTRMVGERNMPNFSQKV